MDSYDIHTHNQSHKSHKNQTGVLGTRWTGRIIGDLLGHYVDPCRTRVWHSDATYPWHDLPLVYSGEDALSLPPL